MTISRVSFENSMKSDKLSSDGTSLSDFILFFTMSKIQHLLFQEYHLKKQYEVR